MYIHNKWKSKKWGAVAKPKTQILLNENGECVAFGIDASDVYSRLDPETQKKWMLFERFKMALYENIDDDKYNDDDDDNDDNDSNNNEEDKEYDAEDEEKNIIDNSSKNKNKNKNKQSKYKKISIRKQLTAMNGKKYPSEKVFVEALKFLKIEATKFFRKLKLGKMKDPDIQWILTVPAIWNDSAKQQMKEWAIAAELVSPHIKNQLKIVFEPDCASLAIQHKIAKAKKKNISNSSSKNHHKKNSHHDNDNKEDDESRFANYSFDKGQKYILIDAGGGTVDIAFHEILGDFGVKECHHPSGGPWGIYYIFMYTDISFLIVYKLINL